MGELKGLIPGTGRLFWNWGKYMVFLQGPKDFSGIEECTKIMRGEKMFMYSIYSVLSRLWQCNLTKGS
jgi:hypothetical protein